MALYRHTGISVESWVEIECDTPIRYEVDRLNQQATLFFGEEGDFVLHLGRKNLSEVADLDAPELI